MRKLRELFGGNLAKILEELSPLIQQIVVSLLTDLLRGLVSPASVTPHAVGAGSSSSSPTTGLTPENMEPLQTALRKAIAWELLHYDLKAQEKGGVGMSGYWEAHWRSVIGGEQTQPPAGE